MNYISAKDVLPMEIIKQIQCYVDGQIIYIPKSEPRACLKNHSRHLHAPLCVIFAPNSVNIARYVSFIRHKSPTNCDAHLTESIFETRSRKKGRKVDTLAKRELSIRNTNIYMEYISGLSIKQLSQKYFLVEKSIQRIVRQEKTKNL